MENKNFESDKLYSTYWWVMKLDHSHPSNYNKKVTEMIGYSKKTGHDEARDKAELLMKKIVMLHSRGYFDKSLSIFIYMREGEFLDKNNSMPLLKMTKRDYKIHDICLADKNFHQEFFLKRGIINFLAKFYDCLKTGNDPKFLIPNSRATFSKDDYLDVTKQHFSTRKHLYAYCQRLIRNGHPYEAVMNFQRKYEERNFANTN